MRFKIKPEFLNLLTIIFFALLTTTQTVGQNTESLFLAKESKHFVLYSSQADVGVLDTLAINLENNYSRITNHLGAQIDKKVKVKVYPDVKAFHVAIKYPDMPDWVVGTCNGDELLMVSPLNPGSSHTYESLMQVAVHEFVHLVVYNALGSKGMAKLPRWLNEGYAQYEAGQLNDNVWRAVKALVTENAPPTWTQLDTLPAIEFGHINGYAFSVTIVEFLVVTYSIDKLALFIKDPDNIEAIYGTTKDVLEQQWVLYLKNKQ